MTRAWRRATALRSGWPGLGWICGGTPVPCAPFGPDAGERRGRVVVEGGEFGGDLRGVLLLAHPDRALAPAVEELLDHRLLAGEQHLARAEHDKLAAEQHAQVVGHGAGRTDVVRDDQERRVGLRVEVDDQLVQVGDADRVEAGVRLVEQDDLGIEDEGAREAGTLAHTAGDLTGQLLLGALEADHLHLLVDDVGDLLLALLGVLTKREGDVVEQVHRPEQRAVLEQDAEQLAGLVELALAAVRDVDVADDDRALVRLEQADQRLQEDRLAGARRAEQDGHLTRRQGQRDVAPDPLLAERLGQVADCYFDTHSRSPFLARAVEDARPPDVSGFVVAVHYG